LLNGVLLIVKFSYLHKVFEILHIMLDSKKEIEEFTVISTMNACFSKGDPSLLEQCYIFILRLYDKNKTFSHTFWQITIEGYMKCKVPIYVSNLLKLYPIRYSYSEGLWKKVISVNNKTDSFQFIFNIFFEKYKHKDNTDEEKGFENIFNLFVEELGNN
jgi:hypothetical protein